VLKKVIKRKDTNKKATEKSLLALELAEIKEVADIIFNRLEKKIAVLEAIEASVDEKITDLEKLIQRVEAIKTPSEGTNRQHEITSLRQKGLKIDEIATILDMPRGEVELILNLSPQKS
jgi:DNA-binding NarL/FixJ family response regulator